MSDSFHHPHDAPVSAGLRFTSELIAWIAGPWAVSLLSNWLVLPSLVLLVGLPAVFSTPGPVRVGIEIALYLVAAIAPWFVWSAVASGLADGIVIASVAVGMPRFSWLIKGAPPDR
jgi:hypothetical protein